MTTRRQCMTVLLAAAAGRSSWVSAQPAAAREAHGALDAFATDGLAMAWAIRRGRDEQATQVVVRVEADPGVFAAMSVTGVDPFGGDRIALMPLRAIGGRVELAVPRARFADHPRSEWRFWRESAPSASAPPALLVYFQGVPDTSPEFDDAGKLDAYLAQRLAAARAPQGKPR